jgi:hypothetical protein
VFLPVRLAVARPNRLTGRNELKSYEEIMEILEAYDLTGSLRAAAELAGCSHHTVERYVGLRDAGQLPTGLEPVERAKLIDPFLDKWSSPLSSDSLQRRIIAHYQSVRLTGGTP